MKQLNVKDQVRLGPARTFALTVNGISVRMFRSLITVAILTLAVTFLCQGLSHTLIVHESRVSASNMLGEYREPNEWGTRLVSPDSRATIWRHLAERDQRRLTEYAQWAGAEAEAVDRHVAAALGLRQYRAYFDSLTDTQRIVLLEGRSVTEALMLLNGAAELEGFGTRLESVKVEPPDGGVARLAAYAREDLPGLMAFTDAVQAGHRRAVERVAQATGGIAPLQWVARQPDDVEPVLSDAGFAAPQGLVDRLRQAGQRAIATQRMGDALAGDHISTILLRELNLSERELTLDRILMWLRDRSNAEQMDVWLTEQRLRDAIANDAIKARLVTEMDAGEQLTDEQLYDQVRGAWTGEQIRTFLEAQMPGVEPLPTAEQLNDAAIHHQRQQRLLAAVGPIAPAPRSGLFDLPINTQWLMMLSFLVCAVGVANAMFMSVTERFTEIATMKCLGALDGFLMQMFLFESAIQGLIGSLLGVVLGIGLALVRGVGTFGSIALASAPLTDLAMVAVISLIVGMILAIAAGVGPALAVARLAPMEAMRIE